MSLHTYINEIDNVCSDLWISFAVSLNQNDVEVGRTAAVADFGQNQF